MRIRRSKRGAPPPIVVPGECRVVLAGVARRCLQPALHIVLNWTINSETHGTGMERTECCDAHAQEAEALGFEVETKS